MQGVKTAQGLGGNTPMQSQSNFTATLNKTEFLENFYVKPEENNLLKPTKRKLDKVPTKKVDLEVFRDKHQKLFDRDIKFVKKSKAEYQTEYSKKMSNLNEKTLFSKFKEPVSENPFEDAKGADATLGQIEIINTAMFAVGQFNLLISGQAYDIEYNDDYSTKLYFLYSFCFVGSVLECVFHYFKLKLSVELQIYRKICHPGTGILNVYKIRDLLPEFILLFIHPSPFLVGYKTWFYSDLINNYFYYHVNDYLSMAQSVKWAYITVLLIFRSQYANSRSHRVCNMFQTQCDTLWVIKCLLKVRPFSHIFIGFIISIGGFGYMQMIAEAPLDRILTGSMRHNYINSCWCAICTMTTVGYGDIYPQTVMGRLIAFLCSLAGVVMVSLLVVAFGTVMTMDNSQSSAFTVIERLKVRDCIKSTALDQIKTINRKVHKPTIDTEFTKYCRIKSQIEDFRKLRQRYKNIQEISAQDLQEKYFHNVLGHLTDIKDMVIDQNEWYEELFYNNLNGDFNESYSTCNSVSEDEVFIKGSKPMQNRDKSRTPKDRVPMPTPRGGDMTRRNKANKQFSTKFDTENNPMSGSWTRKNGPRKNKYEQERILNNVANHMNGIKKHSSRNNDNVLKENLVKKFTELGDKECPDYSNNNPHDLKYVVIKEEERSASNSMDSRRVSKSKHRDSNYSGRKSNFSKKNHRQSKFQQYYDNYQNNRVETATIEKNKDNEIFKHKSGKLNKIVPIDHNNFINTQMSENTTDNKIDIQGSEKTELLNNTTIDKEQSDDFFTKDTKPKFLDMGEMSIKRKKGFLKGSTTKTIEDKKIPDPKQKESVQKILNLLSKYVSNLSNKSSEKTKFGYMDSFNLPNSQEQRFTFAQINEEDSANFSSQKSNKESSLSDLKVSGNFEKSSLSDIEEIRKKPNCSFCGSDDEECSDCIDYEEVNEIKLAGLNDSDSKTDIKPKNEPLVDGNNIKINNKGKKDQVGTILKKKKRHTHKNDKNDVKRISIPDQYEHHHEPKFKRNMTDNPSESPQSKDRYLEFKIDRRKEKKKTVPAKYPLLSEGVRDSVGNRDSLDIPENRSRTPDSDTPTNKATLNPRGKYKNSIDRDNEDKYMHSDQNYNDYEFNKQAEAYYQNRLNQKRRSQNIAGNRISDYTDKEHFESKNKSSTQRKSRNSYYDTFSRQNSKISFKSNKNAFSFKSAYSKYSSRGSYMRKADKELLLQKKNKNYICQNSADNYDKTFETPMTSSARKKEQVDITEYENPRLDALRNKGKKQPSVVAETPERQLGSNQMIEFKNESLESKFDKANKNEGNKSERKNE